MVGFGSSLRMGRRSGWEAAYLDYETLKLLLSQIESVYEEGGHVDSAAAAAAASPDRIMFGHPHPHPHHEHHHPHHEHHHHGGDGRSNRRRDYRDELFLESDSDAAFRSQRSLEGSSSSSSSCSSEDDSLERRRLEQQDPEEGGGVGRPLLSHHPQDQGTINAQRFTLMGSYSSDDGSSDESFNNTTGNCGAAPWSRQASSEVPKKKKKKRKGGNSNSRTNKRRSKQQKAAAAAASRAFAGNEDDFYLPHKHTHNHHHPNSDRSSFFMNDEQSESYPDYYDQSSSSSFRPQQQQQQLQQPSASTRSSLFNNAPFQYDLSPSMESTALLGYSRIPATRSAALSSSTSNSAYYYDNPTTLTSFTGDSTPPRQNFGSTTFTTTTMTSTPFTGGGPTGMAPSTTTWNTLKPKPSPPRRTSQTTAKKTKQEKLEAERRRARKQRRRRKRRQAKHKQRKRQDQRVPPHLRIAHSKARSITERFLGLLRAEVEKVTLFAQARLGELADTAGSLRFLSSEELTEMGANHLSGGAAGYDHHHHPLSDGGIHPSASSSSDEGAGGQKGGLLWSDSSSDEETNSLGSNQYLSQNKKASFANVAGSGSGGGNNNDSSSSSPPKTARHSMPTFGPPTRNNNSKNKSGSHHDGRATTTTPNAMIQNSSPDDSKGRTRRHRRDLESYEAAKRKIEHFQELRQERPIFQRNDHIVGEDLSLVLAVDEADAYSAVGVELLHILKYICVNVIAVRKICCKHDRLLQNRMLGGYYHRKRNTRVQEERTLGGLIAHVAGDIYEAHPALIGLVNHGKLTGVYDLKIQQLANSRTVKVISSCLALALSEYEVSRTRADALATLTKNKGNGGGGGASYKNNGIVDAPVILFDTSEATGWAATTKDRLGSPCRDGGRGDNDSMFSDYNQSSGPPSTESSVSLARLRFTVLSIAALREASRIKSNLFATYLSRSTLSFTGQAVVGEGLDGCSRETLDMMVYYAPDAPLLLDSDTLYEGLRHGRWRNMSIAKVMRSSLAVGLRGGKSFREEEQLVITSLSILPKSEGLDASAPLEGRALPIATSFSISRFVDIPAGLLRCNRYSLLLYTINYYISHPTAATFAEATGSNEAYSAAVIGAARFSSLLVTILHCNVLVGHTHSYQDIPNTRPYKALLIFSAIAAIAGNVVQARGIAKYSLPYAVLGRFLIGLSASDIVHRQFVVTFLQPSLIVAESARLVQFQAIGLVLGLCIGSLVELAPFRSIRHGVQSLQISNWIMVALWLFHLCRLVLSTKTPNGSKGPVYEKMDAAGDQNVDNNAQSQSSDSSDSDPSPGESAILYHQPLTVQDRSEGLADATILSHSTRRMEPRPPPQRQRKTKVLTLMKRLRKLMAYNIAIPVALALVVYATFAQEVLFSSCALITDRYFGWRGNVAGFFLACLALMILPIDFVCEQVARRYEERTTIKRSIVLLAIGLLVMVNWGSVFAMVVNLKILFTETKDMRHHYYDWLFGIPQYVCGFLITFAGVKSLEGASRSLLSKVSPPNIRYLMANVGTTVTFVGLFAQFLANFQIVAVGLSHRVINTDIVNSLVVPLLIGCIVAHYFVRKHYFFLM